MVRGHVLVQLLLVLVSQVVLKVGGRISTMFGALTANDEVLHQRHASIESRLGLAFVGGGR